jgi:Na+/melibiose symporter-like transporter
VNDQEKKAWHIVFKNIGNALSIILILVVSGVLSFSIATYAPDWIKWGIGLVIFVIGVVTALWFYKESVLKTISNKPDKRTKLQGE